jgi:hypothetical protein
MKPQAAMGAMDLFPKLDLPKKLIEEVKGAKWKGKRMPLKIH